MQVGFVEKIEWEVLLKKSLAGEVGVRKKSLDDFTEGINQKIEIIMTDQIFMLS